MKSQIILQGITGITYKETPSPDTITYKETPSSDTITYKETLSPVTITCKVTSTPDNRQFVISCIKYHTCF